MSLSDEVSDEVLDQIDSVVPPGTDVSQLQMAYDPTARTLPHRRRGPAGERTAA